MEIVEPGDDYMDDVMLLSELAHLEAAAHVDLYPENLDPDRRGLALFRLIRGELAQALGLLSLAGIVEALAFSEITEGPLIEVLTGAARRSDLTGVAGPLATARCAAMCALGAAAFFSGDEASALEWFHQSLNLAEAVGDQSSEAAALDWIIEMTWRDDATVDLGTAARLGDLLAAMGDAEGAARVRRQVELRSADLGRPSKAKEQVEPTLTGLEDMKFRGFLHQASLFDLADTLLDLTELEKGKDERAELARIALGFIERLLEQPSNEMATKTLEAMRLRLHRLL